MQIIKILKQGTILSSVLVLLTFGLLLNSCNDEDKKIVPEEESGLPTVVTLTDVQVFAINAIAGGEVTNKGKSEVTERGICWRDLSKPTIENNHLALGSGNGTFSGNIYVLEENRTYYIRAYATNASGTAYGKEVTITTAKWADENMASSAVMNKNAVLEDFTGVRCTFCPQGHAIAQQMIDANPGRVVAIGVNAGSYATPSAGWANFTTVFGNNLINQSGLTGYPAGTINRRVFAGKGMSAGGTAMGRSEWTAAAQEIMTEVSPVNIASQAVFNKATRELTVKVDLYYTGTETSPNRINVALLQSGMVANQSGGSADYIHKHVLRHLLTAQWGLAVPADKTTTGSKYSTLVTYVVPEDYNGAIIPPGGGIVVIKDLEVVVFVSQYKQNILTGINVPIWVK